MKLVGLHSDSAVRHAVSDKINFKLVVPVKPHVKVIFRNPAWHTPVKLLRSGVLDVFKQMLILLQDLISLL